MIASIRKDRYDGDLLNLRPIWHSFCFLFLLLVEGLMEEATLIFM